MHKGTRIVALLAVFVAVITIYFANRVEIDLLRTPGIVVLSSLLMMALSMLMLEHYFTRPSDVLANSTSALLLLLPIHEDLEKLHGWYWAFIIYASTLLILSLISLLLLDPQRAPSSRGNVISRKIKILAVYFGNAKVIWFLVFAGSLFAYVESNSHIFILLFFIAAILIAIEPSKLSLALFSTPTADLAVLAKIFGVQSDNVYLARLESFAPFPKKFDFVQFNMGASETRALPALVIDSYVLGDERWIRLLEHPSLTKLIGGADFATCTPGTVATLQDAVIGDALQSFVGVVRENSDIEEIKFDYAGLADVTEGSLLVLRVGESDVFYQTVNGLTAVEVLESKNEAGVIIGEAVQLGTWNPARQTFEKFGWVPGMNTPVFLAQGGEGGELPAGETKIGQLPGTGYPISIDLEAAVTHHLAVLGITGSGKSVFSRELVRQVIKMGVKVICVDFTGEYQSKLTGKALKDIVDSKASGEISSNLEFIADQMDEFANRRDKAGIAKAQDAIRALFRSAFETFFKGGDTATMFTLPDITNSVALLEYTKWFFKILFEVAKSDRCFGARTCIVLEEAHTIIPEWNFLGIDEKRATALVNSIGQIALQGRKYGIGFFVIAQRTANVSKTVLTQCNSIVAFQQFDRTSSEFLANYLGADFVKVLPRLRPRTAIAVGKAFSGGVPLIFQVPEISEGT